MVTSSGSAAASLPLVGGLAVLDLVNTVSWRGDPGRRTDHLGSGRDCLAWAEHAEVIDRTECASLTRLVRGDAGADRVVLDAVRGLRDVVASALEPGSAPDSEAVRAVVVDALAYASLSASDHRGVRRWVVPGLDERTVARRLALDLQELLTSEHGPVSMCSDPACRWVFLDTSRGHRRLWCRSTDCGNRNRVRRHQERQAARGGDRVPEAP